MTNTMGRSGPPARPATSGSSCTIETTPKSGPAYHYRSVPCHRSLHRPRNRSHRLRAGGEGRPGDEEHDRAGRTRRNSMPRDWQRAGGKPSGSSPWLRRCRCERCRMNTTKTRHTGRPISRRRAKMEWRNSAPQHATTRRRRTVRRPRPARRVPRRRRPGLRPRLTPVRERTRRPREYRPRT